MSHSVCDNCKYCITKGSNFICSTTGLVVHASDWCIEHIDGEHGNVKAEVIHQDEDSGIKNRKEHNEKK